MLSNGTRTTCSDARDATGNYIWRENGGENGRCCGIDFEQAKGKTTNRDAGECGSNDLACQVAKLSTYESYAYDAAIALAHGLDKLVDEGVDPGEMTASRLSRAIRESTFEGVTGRVSFDENGDRRDDDLEYIVYNYQGNHDIHRFEDVGHMVDGGFVRCTDDQCPPIIFHDGSQSPPNVQRTVRETQRHVLFCVLGCRLSEHLHCAPCLSPPTDIVYWLGLNATYLCICDDLCSCSTWAAYSDNLRRVKSAEVGYAEWLRSCWQ